MLLFMKHFFCKWKYLYLQRDTDAFSFCELIISFSRQKSNRNFVQSDISKLMEAEQQHKIGPKKPVNPEASFKILCWRIDEKHPLPGGSKEDFRRKMQEGCQ